MTEYTLIKEGFGSNIINLGDVKTFLRIGNDTNDALLSKLLAVATQNAENATQKSLLNNNFLLVIRNAKQKVIKLPFRPVLSIKSVTITKIKSVREITYKNRTDYIFQKNVGNIILLHNLPEGGTLKIKYKSGYKIVQRTANSNGSTADNIISEEIKYIILKHIYLMYNRIDTEENLNEINSLYSDYKSIRVVV